MSRAQSCQGDATWYDEPQAAYVAEGLAMEFGTVWHVVTHGAHFHVLGTGEPVTFGAQSTPSYPTTRRA